MAGQSTSALFSDSDRAATAMVATVARMATVVATGGETHTDSPSQRIISWTVPVEHMEALLLLPLITHREQSTARFIVCRLDYGRLACRRLAVMKQAELSSIDQGGGKRRGMVRRLRIGRP
jgi:hypothetical protein